jgi:hypothetical protein
VVSGTDPTKLDKDELLAEWAVREEELRLQFESLRSAQTQAQMLLYRYERIFAFCPLPLIVIDNRGIADDTNNAARRLLGDALAKRSKHFLNVLSEETRANFSRAMRQFLDRDAPKAQEVVIGFREHPGSFEALLVALDGQIPPETFVVMLTPVPEDA